MNEPTPQRRRTDRPERVIVHRHALPPLRYTHPGYFVVALGLWITHLGLGFEAIIPGRHTDNIWSVAQDMTGHHFWVWGIGHFATCALILGMYFPQRFWIARVGFLSSLVVFNLLGVSLVASSILHDNASFYTGLATISMSLTSVATFREGQVNPAMAKPS